MHLWRHVQFSLCSLLAAYQYHLQVQGFCEESTDRYCTETLLLLLGGGGGGVLLNFWEKNNYIFYSYIDICVFRAWSKPWQLWRQHHHHQSSPTITAGKVVEEHWGQFLVKDALVLDMVHRHSTCSASLLPHPALPHLPAALQLSDVTRQTSKYGRHRKDPDHCLQPSQERRGFKRTGTSYYCRELDGFVSCGLLWAQPTPSSVTTHSQLHKSSTRTTPSSATTHTWGTHLMSWSQPGQ